MLVTCNWLLKVEWKAVDVFNIYNTLPNLCLHPPTQTPSTVVDLPTGKYTRLCYPPGLQSALACNKNKNNSNNQYGISIVYMYKLISSLDCQSFRGRDRVRSLSSAMQPCAVQLLNTCLQANLRHSVSLIVWGQFSLHLETCFFSVRR